MNLFKKHGFAIFWILATIDLALIFLESEQFRFFTKPLLMPLLLFTILSKVTTRRHKISRLLVSISFLLATVGDVLLLSSSQQVYFIAGLVCFLIMLLVYAVYFLRIQPMSTQNGTAIVASAIFIGMIAGLVLYLLWPYLENLRVPVVIYSLCLVFMFVAAVNVYHYKVTKSLAIEAFIPGALLFVMSDFILASNTFYFNEAFIGIAVMATYCGAQYYIARGFIKHLK
jgi:uncharacterized membrane protein YhhN